VSINLPSMLRRGISGTPMCVWTVNALLYDVNRIVVEVNRACIGAVEVNRSSVEVNQKFEERDARTESYRITLCMIPC
jgi:hypothetical protein